MTTKEKILRILAREKGVVSGEMMAQEVGLSRTSIWKGIQALIKDGAEIDTVAQEGYQMISPPNRLSEDGIAFFLEHSSDTTVLTRDKVTSTNSEVKAALETEALPSLLLASRTQTAGRGRLGRSFHSPEGGIYFSYGWRVQDRDFDAGLITMAVALAFQKAIAKYSDRVFQIKWVNDVLYEGLKVAGILTEATTSLETGRIEYIIIGIGINIIKKEDFPADLDKLTAAVFDDELPAHFNVNELIAHTVDHFRYLVSEGKEEIIPLYKKSCYTLGKPVRYMKDGHLKEALAVDIDDHGSLIIEDNNKERDVLRFGEVQIIKGEVQDE